MNTGASTESHREHDGKKRRLVLLLLLLLFGVVVIWWLFFRGPDEITPEDVADISLEELLIQTRNELEAPGLTVVEAAQNLKNKDAIFEFVKEGIQYVSYAGRLQSPDTIMQTRVANVADRAMVLAALLEEKGIEVEARIAPDWPETGTPLRPDPKFKEPPSLAKLAVKIGYDLSQWREELAEQVKNLRANVDIIREETQTSGDLLKTISGFSADGELEVDAAMLENEWVWVSISGGNEWLDPSFPELDRPADAVKYSEVVPEARITINSRNRTNSETSLLQWSGEVLGRDVSLNFFPTLDTVERLKGSPDPSDIESWFPFLSVAGNPVRGEPFTMDGSSLRQFEANLPFRVENDEVVIPDPVKVTALSINAVDTENWPQVDLAIKADAVGKPEWVAQHFSVLERGVRKPIRINSTYSEPAPVIVVADVTGSMVHDNKYQMIRKIGAGLVSQLNAGQPLAVITFGDGVRVKRLMSPYDPSAGVEEETWQSSIGGDMDYLSAIERALNVIDVDLNRGDAARIVLVTDGDIEEPDSDYVTDLQETIKSRFAESGDVRLFPIGIATKDSKFLSEMARESGGSFFAINPSDDPTTLYNWLGNALSGQILVSYTSQLEDAGNVADLKVSVEGSEPVAEGQFVVPDWDGSNPAAIEVEVAIGSKTFSRTVIDLDSDQAKWRLAGSYQLYATPGPYPAEITAASYVDTWLKALRIKTGKKPNEKNRNSALSFGHVTMTKSHALMTRLSLDNSTQPDYPLVYANKSAFGTSPSGVVRVRSIDHMRTGLWSLLAKSKADALEAGLAAASAEARLLEGAESVNATLSAIRDSLTNIDLSSDEYEWLNAELPGILSGANPIQVFGAKDSSAASWILDTDNGNVLPFNRSHGFISKGVNVAEVAAEFDRIDELYASIGFWGGAAVSGAGLPYTQPFAGLVGFLRTQNKMWCYSTVMMGYVANAIESEDALLNQSVPAAQASAAKLCKMKFNPENFDKAIIGAIAEDWIKAWVSDGFAAGFQNHLYPAAAGTFGPYLGVRPNSPWGQAVAGIWNGPKGTAGGAGAFISSLSGAATTEELVTFINSIGVPTSFPVTSGFHKSMANAVTSIN
ncbi:MAG: vWA domain-containing protein [Pseudomonadota bacterium]